MTRAKISEYDASAANNTDVNGVNIAEGCPPSSMNNMGREIMAALKRFETGADGDSLAKSVCFIFLANNQTKIHPDLLSRFVRFRLSFLPTKIMIERLLYIAQKEGYTSITADYIETNLTSHRADMRHQIQH